MECPMHIPLAFLIVLQSPRKTNTFRKLTSHSFLDIICGIEYLYINKTIKFNLKSVKDLFSLSILSQIHFKTLN